LSPPFVNGARSSTGISVNSAIAIYPTHLSPILSS